MLPMIGPELLLVVLALRAGADVDDAALAQRIHDGDHAAFRTFFDRHHGTLLAYLRRRGVPPEVAEDLVQHAFVYIWEHRGGIDPRRSLRAYLFRIGSTRALNHFRDTARFASDPPLDAVTPAEGEDPDAAVRHRELLQSLHEAVQALPERRRAVFELCFMQDLTYREAAQVLDISIKTVENQMGHAFKALRERLEAFR